MTYAGAKGKFVQQSMKDGKTNEQARQAWKKSQERKLFPSSREHDFIKAGNDSRIVTDNIDRTYDSPMQDWAETSEDF